MRVRLLITKRRWGKVGDELDLAPDVAHTLACQGVAEIIAHDKPAADAPRARMTTRPDHWKDPAEKPDPPDEVHIHLPEDGRGPLQL